MKLIPALSEALQSRVFLMRFYPSQAEELAFYMVFICLFITAHLTLHADNSNV